MNKITAKEAYDMAESNKELGKIFEAIYKNAEVGKYYAEYCTSKNMRPVLKEELELLGYRVDYFWYGSDSKPALRIDWDIPKVLGSDA